jgi:ATP-binding cassette subfamily B protein
VRGLGYRYTENGPPVLSEVDLDLPHGQRIALVGPTGAGKSTLAKLIARMDDPTDGVVSYGGVDLRTAAAVSRRERIAMLTQEVHVFRGSVADNVRVVRPEADDEEVREALRRVGALERFEKLADGLDSPVGRKGALLSAGERQLIALARVALLDCDVLIVDEATSNLDPMTEAQVTAALESSMRGRTVIVIAHRLSTIRAVDRVAVVSGGGISEFGTHEELIARGGQFAALHGRWLAAAGTSA